MIKRFTYNDCTRSMLESESGKGDFVRYSDYMAHMGNLKRKIADLEADRAELTQKLTWWEYKARDLQAKIVEYKTKLNK